MVFGEELVKVEFVDVCNKELQTIMIVNKEGVVLSKKGSIDNGTLYVTISENSQEYTEIAVTLGSYGSAIMNGMLQMCS
jgi:hypothetical protein